MGPFYACECTSPGGHTHTHTQLLPREWLSQAWSWFNYNRRLIQKWWHTLERSYTHSHVLWGWELSQPSVSISTTVETHTCANFACTDTHAAAQPWPVGVLLTVSVVSVETGRHNNINFLHELMKGLSGSHSFLSLFVSLSLGCVLCVLCPLW